MKPIQFFFESPAPAIKERNKLRSFLIKVLRENQKVVDSINVIFCSDSYLLSINKSFLNHDYYTDIITFDLSKNKKAPLQAEIYISVDRVKENAITHQSTIKTELHRVIFHGFLHLVGYSDKTKSQQLIMRKEENKLLNRYFGLK